MLRDLSSAAVFCIIILYLALNKMSFWAKENTETVGKNIARLKLDLKFCAAKYSLLFRNNTFIFTIFTVAKNKQYLEDLSFIPWLRSHLAVATVDF